MIDLIEHVYDTQVSLLEPVFLVGDIGGTNCNFGVGQLRNGVVHLMRSLHVKTATVVDFTATVHALLIYLKQQYAYEPTRACFAVAGPVLPPYRKATLSNACVTVDADALCMYTQLKHVTIVNDFEVVGYGIDLIAPTSLVCVQEGMYAPQGNKAILGAGTGLGASILQWIPTINRYVPVASEGGHMDFAPQTLLDMQLSEYVKQQYATQTPVSWEQILSGNGIGTLYQFLATVRTYTHEDTALRAAHGPHPDEIFASRVRDARAADTCDLYTHYYAQCARNWALATMALGGLYIAGGIAAHNAALFARQEFLEPFGRSYKHADLLRKIPVWVITDYAVSLYGALAYMQMLE